MSKYLTLRSDGKNLIGEIPGCLMSLAALSGSSSPIAPATPFENARTVSAAVAINPSSNCDPLHRQIFEVTVLDEVVHSNEKHPKYLDTSDAQRYRVFSVVKQYYKIMHRSNELSGFALHR